jgi:hypothetical protein
LGSAALVAGSADITTAAFITIATDLLWMEQKRPGNRRAVFFCPSDRTHNK